MITAVVTFKLPPGVTREKWQENIKQVSARFQNVPGLIRKQFLFDERGIGGGVRLPRCRPSSNTSGDVAVIAFLRSELEASGKPRRAIPTSGDHIIPRVR
jgi:hypothetical protein